MAFVEVAMPLVFGTAQIFPLKQFRNLPAYLVQRLASSSESLEAYLQHFDNAYGVFVLEENLRRLDDANPSAVGQFVIEACRQLSSANAALLSSPPARRPYTGSVEEIIRAYANVKHRRVPKQPRKVHKATYSVPSNLASGEQAFLTAVEVGDDLRPYQSTHWKMRTSMTGCSMTSASSISTSAHARTPHSNNNKIAFRFFIEKLSGAFCPALLIVVCAGVPREGT